MKLVRNGEPGREKPGLVDAEGHIRDLSAHVPDIRGETLSTGGLARLRALIPARYRSPAGRTIGACVGQVGNFIAIGLNYADHAAETGRPSGRAHHLQQGAVLHRRPQRQRNHPAGLEEDRLGGRARHRDR